MYSFCPHCGQSIDQNQAPGQKLICVHCGQEIGIVATPQKVVEEIIPAGAAQCPVCRQVVEVRSSATGQQFVPHYAGPGIRKMCPNKVVPSGA